MPHKGTFEVDFTGGTLSSTGPGVSTVGLEGRERRSATGNPGDSLVAAPRTVRWLRLGWGDRLGRIPYEAGCKLGMRRPGSPHKRHELHKPREAQVDARVCKPKTTSDPPPRMNRDGGDGSERFMTNGKLKTPGGSTPNLGRSISEPRGATGSRAHLSPRGRSTVGQ